MPTSSSTQWHYQTMAEAMSVQQQQQQMPQKQSHATRCCPTHFGPDLAAHAYVTSARSALGYSVQACSYMALICNACVCLCVSVCDACRYP